MAHLFTLAQAEELLPRLTVLLTELRDGVIAFDEVRERLSGLPEAARGNGHAAEATALEGRAAALVQAINALIERVHGLGVEIKDPRTGLIDFRSPREGRVVYLCWRLGEPRIAYWHELDAGFAGRQPL